jgi:DNA-directed RNA polymerase sigma subunit (sigma70/sigma32)
MAQQENVLTSLPRLTDGEKRELEQRARLGDERARQQLIESSLQYVASVAWDKEGLLLLLASLASGDAYRGSEAP